jgi:hypothetical protein
MNVGIGVEAAQYLFGEHIDSIFCTVHGFVAADYLVLRMPACQVVERMQPSGSDDEEVPPPLLPWEHEEKSRNLS